MCGKGRHTKPVSKAATTTDPRTYLNRLVSATSPDGQTLDGIMQKYDARNNMFTMWSLDLEKPVMKRAASHKIDLLTTTKTHGGFQTNDSIDAYYPGSPGYPEGWYPARLLTIFTGTQRPWYEVEFASTGLQLVVKHVRKRTERKRSRSLRKK
jgi:hypothetical protein